MCTKGKTRDLHTSAESNLVPAALKDAGERGWVCVAGAGQQTLHDTFTDPPCFNNDPIRGPHFLYFLSMSRASVEETVKVAQTYMIRSPIGLCVQVVLKSGKIG